jgi:hypothetical protein
MRRSGSPKQLECHGFICASAEDAIIMAANLYQSLLDTMKKHKNAGQVKKKPEEEKPLPRNELVRQSVRKSLRRPAADPPVRPPRRKRREGGRDEARLVTGLQRRRSVRGSVRSNRSSVRSRAGAKRQAGLAPRQPDGARQNGHWARSEFGRQSTRKSGRGRSGQPAMGNMKSNGDLFTKVSIGRTKSFVKTGNQYNLQELFRELKEKEGVESIDDVLRRVISPNGMSFNDIKPVYRELLLKLAMTMSQDEIFERSKTIMAHNKKSRKKQQAADQKADIQTGSLGSFFKSFSKSNSKSSTMASSSKKSSMSSVSIEHAPSRGRNTFDSGFASHSSRTTKSNKGRSLTKADISGPIPIVSKASPRAVSPRDQVDDAYGSCSECTYETYGSCTYESCRLKAPQRRPSTKEVLKLKPKESTAGESTCSGCDDADSCISGDKCYCSLRGDPRAGHPAPPSVYSDSGTTTDTTCYSCSQPASSRVDLSSCESPGTAWRRNSRAAPPSSCCTCSDYSGSVAATASTRLSPGGVGRKNSGGSGYQSNDSYTGPQQTWRGVKQAGQRNDLRDGRGSSGGSSCSSSSPRSSASPQLQPPLRGNLIYRGATNSKPIVTRAQDEENIMSLKKSAEIAALFSGARINQTTDLVDQLDPDSGSEMTDTDYRGSEAHSRMSQKLGYFP